MPATDLSADVIIHNFSGAYIQERYRADGVTESNLYKLCRAVYNGFHKESGEALEDLEPQRFDETAEQGFLDNRANFWNVPRRSGESDAALRVRIGQRKLVQWGAFNIDEMLNLIATLLDADVSQITFTENIDESGNWEPALISFHIDPNAFIAQGITDVATAIQDLNDDLEMVAPAGVRVIATSTGSAVWDSGDLWDGGETWS